MNDTHDERGGDETPLARVQAFQRAANPNGDYHWPAEEAANVNGVPLYFDDIESLSAADNFDAVDAVVARWRKAEEQLAAATALAEKAEALVADAEMRADKFCGAFSDASSLAYRRGKLLDEALTRQTELARERDSAVRCIGLLRVWLDELGYDAPYVDRRLRHYTTAPDAAPEARSEPVERSETSGGHGEGSNSRATAAGLSEAEPPRDTSAWCWAPNPNGPLCCGRLRDHEPPHRRGERTWTDDTTEDGQHG